MTRRLLVANADLITQGSHSIMKRSATAVSAAALLLGMAYPAAAETAAVTSTAADGSAAASTAVAPATPVTVLTTRAPNGTPDPHVEVLVNGTWTPAKAYNFHEYETIKSSATGYVNATGDTTAEASRWDPTRANQRYRVGFDLPADATNLALSGSMLADNVGTAYLNTTQVGAQPYAYTQANFRWWDRAEMTGTPIGTTDQGAFLLGQRNYLFFDVHNFDLQTALNFLATVTYDQPVANEPPVISSLAGPTAPAALGAVTTVSAPFTDANAGDTHTCTVSWGDGTTSTGTISHGTCSAQHTYAAAGIHTVTVTVTDQHGASDTEALSSYVVVYDPSGGFVTGGGWIDSPAGAYAAAPSLTGKANFGFVARYKKGASVPDGQTQFQFRAAGFNFHSTAYQYLVVAGAKAQYKGTGQVNGAGEYGFLLTANDGQAKNADGVDRIRLKVWDRTTGSVIYDNQIDSTDDAAATDAIENGSIVIHTS